MGILADEQAQYLLLNPDKEIKVDTKVVIKPTEATLAQRPQLKPMTGQRATVIEVLDAGNLLVRLPGSIPKLIVLTPDDVRFL